jgi:hypothetical protein
MTKTALQAAFTYHRQQGDPPSAALARARFDETARQIRYPSSVLRFGDFSPKATRDRVYFFEAKTAWPAPFRFVAFADEILGLRHEGWLTDDDFSVGTLRGAVFQLSPRRGRERFVAGYLESTSRTYLVDLSSIFESDKPNAGEESPCEMEAARDAARSADSFAEDAAEKAREYQEAWRSGLRWAELGASIIEDRRAALAILSERRSVASLDKPALCAAIRARVDSLIEAIADARRERAKLVEVGAYWLSTDGPEAFNEGAGQTVFA